MLATHCRPLNHCQVRHFTFDEAEQEVRINNEEKAVGLYSIRYRFVATSPIDAFCSLIYSEVGRQLH